MRDFPSKLAKLINVNKIDKKFKNSKSLTKIFKNDQRKRSTKPNQFKKCYAQHKITEFQSNVASSVIRSWFWNPWFDVALRLLILHCDLRHPRHLLFTLRGQIRGHTFPQQTTISDWICIWKLIHLYSSLDFSLWVCTCVLKMLLIVN